MPRPTAEAKTLGFREAFLSYFFGISQINKNDQIVLSTLWHATISNKSLKSNGIKNREVPYWQRLLWEEVVNS